MSILEFLPLFLSSLCCLLVYYEIFDRFYCKESHLNSFGYILTYLASEEYCRLL